MNGIKILAGIVLAGVLAGAIGSCRSTKTIRKVIATPAPRPDTVGAAKRAIEPVRDLHADSIAMIHSTINGLYRNHVDFQSFSGKIHVHFQSSDGKDYEVTAFVRIKKDSLIWLSIVGSLGPVSKEVIRAMITPDSVKVRDNREKVIRMRSVSYLQEQVHLPVDFKALQDLLIGNPIFLDTSRVLYYRTETKGISLFSAGAEFSNFLTLNPDLTMKHSKVDDVDPLRARTCDLTYGDYDYSGVVPFSAYRKISVEEKSKVDIELGYKQYKFNEPLSYPWQVPKNFKYR
ncbi:MAG TPA: DUF4292 domain-containing protein [Puia sp.]|jgi:hypothetical protein|nr:DUF4292 domain-containing protein [Puia sp.]